MSIRIQLYLSTKLLCKDCPINPSEPTIKIVFFFHLNLKIGLIILPFIGKFFLSFKEFLIFFKLS